MRYNRINIITSAPKPPEASILIIYTGGTLGMIHDAQGALKPFDFSSILDHVPSLRQLELNLTVISFEVPIDSSDISPTEWVQIGKLIYSEYDNFDGFVVLHGTDTMAYSASALSFMLENLSKPVIFTGAQLPISSFRSDARENVITAIEIAAAKENGAAIVPEVCIFFDYKLFRGNRSKKVESLYFDAFESENYAALAESGVVINYNRSAILKSNKKHDLILHDRFDNNVAILKLYPGMTKSYVTSVLGCDGLRGVVLETFGAGNAPTANWLIELIEEAIKKGITVVNISQCPGGTVMQGRYETSKRLKEIGVVGGMDMTLEAAITKLMIILGDEKDMTEISLKINASKCGELSLN
ncbi:asparaginase [Fulvivirga sp. M361]|uniref:asparaginase n=1 Tax=Fulvivirga sp. M361 TaxID=2594266 RepID=UPI00117BA10F|nr:asparaginase [Fulvivirga sp. M361]TRX62129.1 asparaginase [Fulvivirga sp. M361]